ncbi:MAG: hypothetical protein L0Z50_05130 [Verrucomicrobiales bacterium]|nr:hypothetical protein [Verrucomicrobiales bacterium]
MTRHFSVPKVLRMTPNRLLQEFFNRLGHKLLSLDWRKVKEYNVEPLLLSMSWLAREAQDEIESTLASIFELASESGSRAIVEVAHQDGQADAFGDLPEDVSCYERAMWTWLNHPKVFEQASLIHQVENLTRWRKRSGLPRIQPRATPAATRELAIALSQCLRREEGRGQRCTIEYFRRRDGADVFVAYPDDFVQTILQHDNLGRLVPRPLRPTFEIAFAYREDEGTLELFAQVAPALKPKLESLFGQIILDADLDASGSSRPYDLNRLKDRYFCLETDPTDHVSASIARLRLEVPGYGRLTVEPTGHCLAGNVFEVIDDCLNEQAVPWEIVNISLATFRFQFAAVSGRQPGTLTFDVTFPDHCCVKSRRPERIELTRKYLRHWRIARA